MLTFGSLFAGIGGFDLGFERAGMRCLWQVEINDKCKSVLRRHFPGTTIIGDVKNAGQATLPPVDVICGGFPCQDVSVAGKREGLAGERSGLWYEFHRVLAELRPRWAVIENVPGLLSSGEGRDFAAVLSGLADIGYYAAWRVLDAQFDGVAQRRRRVFVVASFGNGRCAEVLFEREGSAWDSPPGRETGERLATDIAASIRSGGTGKRGWIGDAEQGVVAEPITFDWQQGVAENDRSWMVDKPGRTRGLSASRTLAVAATLNSGGNNGGFRTEPGAHLVAFQETGMGWWNESEAGQALGVFRQSTDRNLVSHTLRGGDTGWCGSEDGTGRGTPLVAAPLTAGSGGRTHSRQIAGGFGVRRLTPTECERLQGFPDGWTAGQSDSSRYRQLGNAVAVPCAEWIGRRIVEAAG